MEKEREYFESLINLISKYAQDETITSFLNDDKAIFDDCGAHPFAFKTKEIIDRILAFRNEWLTKLEDERTKNMRYTKCTHESNEVERQMQNSFEKEVKSKDQKLKIYKEEIEQTRNQIKILEEKNKEVSKELELVKTESYDQIKRIRSKHKHKTETLEKTIGDLKNRLKIENEQTEKAAKDLYQLSTIQQKLQQKEENEKHLKLLLTEKREEINHLLKEKDDLQIRLSGIAGDKLTKGNPAIADLGDPNRPMKIAEKYGELYDNEWTDGMECIESLQQNFPGFGKPELEEIVTHHLFRILMCCYLKCVKLSENQLQNIRQTLCLKEDDNLYSVPILKEILAVRKEKADIFSNYLLNNKVIEEKAITENWTYKYRNEKLIELLMETPFFEKCINLCWSMSVQDPKMYLDEEIKPDVKYDKNIYKEFVQSGDIVSYVVWPALFLHKDGPLLYKGVVQSYWEHEGPVTAV